MFPDVTMPGVDVILPDTKWLQDRSEDLAGVIVTHGHEDHLGGVPHLLKQFEVPLYGSELTMGLARQKVIEARLEDRTSFHVVSDGQRFQVGPFDIEVLPITHSVPQSLCVVLHTPQGVIVHTGDFKIDREPIDGRITDIERLKELREGGVRLLMADSTNADKPGWSPSESTVGDTLRQLISKWGDQRLIISCFASHLHRVQQICDIAISEGRTIFPLGRSMVGNIRIAQEIGVLNVPHRAIDSIDRIGEYDPEAICVICTGSQGEANAALSLLARGDHPDLSLSEDDVVLLSSHPIPGNELPVYRMINRLTRLGCEVVHDGFEHVHTTGHAQREELRYLYEAVLPEWYLPVEGEHRMLRRNADLAIEVGHPSNRTIVADDGDQVTLDANGLRFSGRIAAPYHYVDGLLDDLSPDLLEDRRKLGEGGFVHVTVILSQERGLIGHPDISTLGWLDAERSVQVLAELEVEVSDVVNAAIDAGEEREVVERLVRRTTGRFVGNRTRRRPPISASVILVD